MRLLGRTGQLAGRTVAVAGPLRIGRAPENELQLSVDGVSRTHARVSQEGDAFWVEDLGSANGTFLNGVRVTKERLAHLDVITIGRLADLIVDARDIAPVISVATGDVSLQTIDGPDEGASVAVPVGEVTIGRVAPATILIDSRVVSKLHARLRRSSDRLAIDDLDSPNGTFVNGARITTNRSLAEGDTISIAGVRSYRVRMTASRAAAPAAAMPVVAMPIGGPEPVPAFNQEWKTRLVWSPDELAAVEAERARVIEEVRKATGGLPGQDSGASPPAPSASVARKTEFIGRDQLPVPPAFTPPTTAAAPPAEPAARKTEFMGRDQVPVPPAFTPATSAAPPPIVPAAAPPPSPAPPVRPPATPDIPATSAFRPGADLPPIFADAPPDLPSAPPPPPPVAAPRPTPALPADVAPPSTSAFRPGADLPPTFAEVPPTAPFAVPAAPRLIGLRGAAGDFTLAEGSSIVGRQEGVAICISDRQVSRHHAVITLQQGRVTIEDKSSANGTFVNGARLTTPRVLTVGDQVKFGDLLFTVVAKN